MIEDNEVVTTTAITVTADGQPIEATTRVIKPSTVYSLNKSFSELALNKHMVESETESDSSLWEVNRTANARKNTRKATPVSTGMRKTHSASERQIGIHFFVTKTVLRPRTCVTCKKRIRSGRVAMKCKDCRSTCHPDCKDKLLLPCIDTVPTPGPGKIRGKRVLSEYCMDECPMIPGIVIHCVNEVETRGLHEVGIYVVPGSKRLVKKLQKKFFRGKGLPDLSNVDDIHVVCSCLKDFLWDVKEPLVTYRLWKNFVEAAVNTVQPTVLVENPDKPMAELELYETLNKLPRANRDTVAFIMLHLLRLSQAPDCKMPASNLSGVFGPIIVGHSTPEPESIQRFSENRYQTMVMDRLFDIPEDYWMNCLLGEADNMYPDVNTPHTPDVTRGELLGSRPGPVDTQVSYDGSRTWPARTPREEEEKSKLANPLRELRPSIRESSV